MQQEGCASNHLMFPVLDACASIAALEEGRSMNEEIAQSVEVQFFCE